MSGLITDSLGNYLASLGLLRVLSRQWPTVRASWRDGAFTIVGGPAREELIDNLCEIAKGQEWTRYTGEWLDAQKLGTKEKSGLPLALWRANADEAVLELFDAHDVSAVRTYYNPLLGTGGNAGKRKIYEGWARAIRALCTDAVVTRDAIAKLILGEPQTWLVGKLNAACWFSSANKLYNSGQSSYRDGALSPWLMALACEGLPFFAGAPSRRLGARSNRIAAFPFITQACAPSASGEVERDEAEVWAPLWGRPMSVAEVKTLFLRGRAEIGNRGALTPAQFAVAITRRGVDAGITGFARFVLGQTTSAQTFEPRSEGIVDVRAASSDHARATALQRVIHLVNQLPTDRSKNEPFIGVRGPLEAALIDLVKAGQSAEASRNLLDAVASALDRVDRNAALRAKLITWKPLPIDWVAALFSDGSASTEARLALALVAAFPRNRPFATYRFGVDSRNRGDFIHLKRRPARSVWRPGPLSSVLSEVLLRWLLDWSADEEKALKNITRRNYVVVALHDIDRWVSGSVDEELLGHWLSRFALFDWEFVPRPLEPPYTAVSSTPLLSLYGLLQPLFDCRPVHARFDDSAGARTPAAAKRLAALLFANQIDEAIVFAASRYAMANVPLMRCEVEGWNANAPRLLASVLFPISEGDRGVLLHRWFGSGRKQEVAHA